MADTRNLKDIQQQRRMVSGALVMFVNVGDEFRSVLAVTIFSTSTESRIHPLRTSLVSTLVAQFISLNSVYLPRKPAQACSGGKSARPHTEQITYPVPEPVPVLGCREMSRVWCFRRQVSVLWLPNWGWLACGRVALRQPAWLSVSGRDTEWYWHTAGDHCAALKHHRLWLWPITTISCSSSSSGRSHPSLFGSGLEGVSAAGSLFWLTLKSLHTPGIWHSNGILLFQ